MKNYFLTAKFKEWELLGGICVISERHQNSHGENMIDLSLYTHTRGSDWLKIRFKFTTYYLDWIIERERRFSYFGDVSEVLQFIDYVKTVRVESVKCNTIYEFLDSIESRMNELDHRRDNEILVTKDLLPNLIL
jgi:hypothetical protein